MKKEVASQPAHLSIKGLRAGYGRTEVLHDIDLEVCPGEVVALLGSNGAGKSTLARAITGFCTVTSGSISLSELQLVGRKPHLITRAGVGHVAEGRRLFGGLTVAENMELAFFWQKVDAARRQELVEEVWDRFPRLRDRGQQRARTLSGGEQQMLAIARALLLRPRLLILDEPSTGLAPIIVEQIFRIIQDLGKELGVSMLLIEQNVGSALEFADRGYVLQRGAVVGAGSAADLRVDPEIRALYLGK
jgi:branched-chain amino acid transport system ATP-binding protein